MSTVTGTCVIRIEQTDRSGVRVTLRGNLDVADPAGEWVVRTADVERARALVGSFFTDFLGRG